MSTSKTKVQNFNNGIFNLDVIKGTNDEILFNVGQVGIILGMIKIDRKNTRDYVRPNMQNINKILSRFEDCDLKLKKDDYISEAAVYHLVMKANNNLAVKFQMWLANNVIPSIRRHGAYMTDTTIENVLENPDLLIKLAQNLKKEKEARLQAEMLVHQQKPKVAFADSVLCSSNSILVRDMAVILKQNGYEIGEKRLFKWLRENGYLVKKGSSYNNPTQYSMEQGLFEVSETTVNTSHSVFTKITPKITGKGQIYFLNKFKNPNINLKIL